MSTLSTTPHIILFPFMSQGHTIPLLHLARVLADRHITVTVIATSSNHPTIKSTINHPSITIKNLTFLPNTQTGPPGVEIIENLPSLTSFINFLESTKQLQPQFEKLIQNLLPVTSIISDGFLTWTQNSAEKFNIPRFVFYGTNISSMTMCNIMAQFKPHAAVSSGDEVFNLPDFTRFKLTTNDFEPPFSELEPKGPWFDALLNQHFDMIRSHGMLVNSFYEIEHEFNDYWNRNYGPKAWLVGPFCVAKQYESNVADSELSTKVVKKPTWIQWLDTKRAANEPVLYVSFGTQAEASTEQLNEVAIGLERSKVSFLWVVKQKEMQLIGVEFEKRVTGRGKVVAEWVDQMEILKHEIVTGFLSHCGWNSMLESMCAGVAVLAMPLMAEQHLNARLVVEEIGMGLRLWSRGGVARGIVEADEVEKMVVELMEGDGGKRVRKRVIELKEMAYGAMKEGGSSSRTLDSLIEHVCGATNKLV